MIIIEEALAKMNYWVHTPTVGDYKLCSHLTFRKIISAYGLRLNNKVEELQLKFGVNEDDGAIFEAFAFVGTHARSTVLISSGYRGSIVNTVYRGFPTRIKIFGIKRRDRYAGKCEYVTRSMKIKSEYCLCDDYVLDSYMIKAKPSLSGK